jgi:hypothetical protein
MTRASKRRATLSERQQGDIDEAIGDFHNTAVSLHYALTYAHSIESDGEFIEAMGAAVTYARRLVAIDDKMRKIKSGEQYEPTLDHIDPALQERIDESKAVRAIKIMSDVVDALISDGNTGWPDEAPPSIPDIMPGDVIQVDAD